MKGFRVIELGAGPGLAGSVAALAGTLPYPAFVDMNFRKRFLEQRPENLFSFLQGRQ